MRNRRHAMNVPPWIIALAVLTVWLSAPAAGAVAAETVDRIVAIVNEDIITQYDIDQALRPMLQSLRSQGMSADRERQASARLREDALNNLIDAKLTEQEIKRYKIAVTDEEVEVYIRQFKERRSLSDEALKAMLAQEGMTPDEYRREVRLQLQRTKLVNREVRSRVVITQDEIKRYYEKNRQKYGGGTQYYLWNLFVKLPPNAGTGIRNEARERLARAEAELTAGRAFEDLARAHASGEQGIEGADLGWFRLDELTPQLREAVQPLKAGQRSPTVETDFGFQIVYIQRIQAAAGKPLPQVEAEIQDILFREVVDSRFSTWISELRKRSHIKIVAP
jgi:peptidyl-prolyl cis-trans isomerase SurA